MASSIVDRGTGAVIIVGLIDIQGLVMLTQPVPFPTTPY